MFVGIVTFLRRKTHMRSIFWKSQCRTGQNYRDWNWMTTEFDVVNSGIHQARLIKGVWTICWQSPNGYHALHGQWYPNQWTHTIKTNVLEHILVCFWKWGILQDTRNMAQYGNMLGETWWASGLPIFGVWEATNRRSHFKHQVAIKVQRNMGNMVKVGVFGDVPGHISVATSEIQLRNLDPALIHTDVKIFRDEDLNLQWEGVWPIVKLS